MTDITNLKINSNVVSDSGDEHSIKSFSSTTSSLCKKKKNNNNRKRKLLPDDDGDEEEKQQRLLEERRAANRRSAFESRQRRKILIDNLQESVGELTKENAAIRKKNEDLHKKLDQLLLACRLYQNQTQNNLLSSAALPTLIQSCSGAGSVGCGDNNDLLSNLLKQQHQVLPSLNIIESRQTKTESKPLTALEAVNDISHFTAAQARIQALTMNGNI